MYDDNVANVQAFTGRQCGEHNVIMERGARQDPPRTQQREGAGDERRRRDAQVAEGWFGARMPRVERKGCWEVLRGWKNSVSLTIHDRGHSAPWISVGVGRGMMGISTPWRFAQKGFSLGLWFGKLEICPSVGDCYNQTENICAFMSLNA